MTNPCVSVIIPNYNHSIYLIERIESILNQTYDNYEVIILDDKSPDNSVEIINQYRNHPKVSAIVINENNSGSTFKQWEKGFRLAKGDYIWIAESDDSMDSSFLKDIMYGMQKYPTAVVGFSNTTLINSDGNVININLDSDDNYNHLYSLHKGLDFIYDKMLYHNRVYNASAVVFKKSSLNSISQEFMNYRFCGDWVFWIELMNTGDVIWLHKKLNKFRQHLNKVSPKADIEGLDFKEKHILVKYLKNKMSLSYFKVSSIVGNIFLNLIRSKVISKEARKIELLAWMREYPMIILYATIRFLQVCPFRLAYKLRLIKSIDSVRVVKQFN